MNLFQPRSVQLTLPIPDSRNDGQNRELRSLQQERAKKKLQGKINSKSPSKEYPMLKAITQGDKQDQSVRQNRLVSFKEKREQYRLRSMSNCKNDESSVQREAQYNQCKTKLAQFEQQWCQFKENFENVHQEAIRRKSMNNKEDVVGQFLRIRSQSPGAKMVDPTQSFNESLMMTSKAIKHESKLNDQMLSNIKQPLSKANYFSNINNIEPNTSGIQSKSLINIKQEKRMNPKKNLPIPQKHLEPESNKKVKINKEEKMEQLTRSFFTRNKQMMSHKTDGEGKVNERVKKSLHFKSPSNENFRTNVGGHIVSLLANNQSNLIEGTERIKQIQTPTHSSQQSFSYVKDKQQIVQNSKKNGNCSSNYHQLKEKQNDVKVMNINLITTKNYKLKQREDTGKITKKSGQQAAKAPNMFMNFNMIKK